MSSESLFFKHSGAGSPVLLIHGLGASLHQWDRLVPELVGAGYSTYALDLPGHGNSEKPLEKQAYDVENILDRIESWVISQKLDLPFALCGHSLGGFFAMQLALRNPVWVQSLVLVDPFYGLEQIPPVFRLGAKPFSKSSYMMGMLPDRVLESSMKLYSRLNGGLSEQARIQGVLDYKRASPHINSIIGSAVNHHPFADQINAPALVLWGDRDLSLSPRSFPALVEMLPHAEGVRFAGCGHLPHQARPREFNQKVLQFLAAHDGKK